MAQSEVIQAIFADSLEAWRKRDDIYKRRIHYRRGDTHPSTSWETTLRRILSLRSPVDSLVEKISP